MILTLNEHYRMHLLRNDHEFKLQVFCGQLLIGEACLTTDQVDVACITHLWINKNHIQQKINDEVTVGKAFIKCLLKFPFYVRKPEFRFILNIPDELKLLVAEYHVDEGKNTQLENEMMVRETNIIPTATMPENTIFKRSLNQAELPALLSFLKQHAYWQANLTLERLKLLITHSEYFIAQNPQAEIIGFARVVSNHSTFASLWDVVVHENYRQQGIGTALMIKVFTDPQLVDIPYWVLFTESAKILYEKFGFVAESKTSNRFVIQKLRLQETPPPYMQALIQSVRAGLPSALNQTQTMEYLFGAQGKRNCLSTFWKNITTDTNLKTIDHQTSMQWRP